MSILYVCGLEHMHKALPAERPRACPAGLGHFAGARWTPCLCTQVLQWHFCRIRIREPWCS